MSKRMVTTSRSLKWKIRYTLFRLGLIELFELTQVLGRYFFGQVHEKDFLIFRGFSSPTPGLFVDVGANIGQSALSMRIACPGLHTLSFEPNPAHQRKLQIVQRILGSRFRFRILGIGNQAGRLRFYLPRVDGFLFSQEATLDPAVLRDPETLDRFEQVTGSRTLQIEEAEVELETLDEALRNETLVPQVIKIDVQGFEVQALEGMKQTLDRHKPILMIEAVSHKNEIIEFAISRGYVPITEHPLIKDSINLFFVHPNGHQLFSK